MNQLLKFVALALAVAPWTNAFPAHGSLGGLSKEQLDAILPRLDVAAPEGPPGPISDTSLKLVNDADHPYIAPGPGDLRGPCPAFNTLANHGYLPRNGIVTPAQILNAVQEGFNMAYKPAAFTTYMTLLGDGNPITNLFSIGGKTTLTGEDPPAPAIVGGLSTPQLIEGDASLSRGDAYFGDNHTFNQTIWDKFIDFSNRFGAGKYNLTVAAELRHQRIQDSIATNPNFLFVDLRFNTGYSSSVFPLNFFVDGRQNDGQLDLDVATGFFRDGRMPDGFFRSPVPRMSEGAATVLAAHPILPGKNMGAVNTYTPDPDSSDLTTPCKLYTNFINRTLKSLYPAPTGDLRDALNRNLGYLYQFVDPSCPQVFPYGQ